MELKLLIDKFSEMQVSYHKNIRKFSEENNNLNKILKNYTEKYYDFNKMFSKLKNKTKKYEVQKTLQNSENFKNKFILNSSQTNQLEFQIISSLSEGKMTKKCEILE